MSTRWALEPFADRVAGTEQAPTFSANQRWRSQKPFSSSDVHYPGLYSSVLYLKNSDRDWQFESPWSRAARIEVENSIAPTDAWSMRVSANDGRNSSGDGIEVKFVDVVDHVEFVSC